MKSKIITIAAFLAVMVAMTGVAVANPFNLAITGGTNPVELAPGQSVTLDLEGTLINSVDAGSSFTLTKSVSCVTPGCTTGDVTVTTSPAFGPVSSPTFTQPGAVTIALSGTPVDAPGTKYLITVQAGPNTATLEFGVATRSLTSIPEFPTVAMPVAAAIGLLFFFQYKKRKEKQ